LIEEIGILSEKRENKGNFTLTVNAEKVMENLKLGDSVATNGVCLTVTAIQDKNFSVDATTFTAKGTTIGSWKNGQKLNLERALMVGDRLGGHIVQGHVDGVGKVARISYTAGHTNIHINTSPNIIKLLAPKGSITVNGVSLTLASKSARGFVLMIVPFTMEHTNLGELKPGDEVNLETDLIIRWLADQYPEGEVVGDQYFRQAGLGNIHTED